MFTYLVLTLAFYCQ